MAIDAYMTVTPTGLIPQTEVEAVQGLRVGSTVRAKITNPNPRNAAFFRKWWTLVNFAFDHWEPGEILHPGIGGFVPQKDKENFRRKLTILAGYFRTVINLDGTTELVAESIAWHRMDEDRFEKLYSNTINVVLERVLTQYTREDLDDVVAALLAGYA